MITFFLEGKKLFLKNDRKNSNNKRFFVNVEIPVTFRFWEEIVAKVGVFKKSKNKFVIFCCRNPDADGNATDDNSGASGAAAQEVEIVFKLHPEMLADIAQKDAVKAMKDNATRYIKTTSRALVEHLCKYLAMRIALDLAKTTSAASTQGKLLRGIIN